MTSKAFLALVATAILLPAVIFVLMAADGLAAECPGQTMTASWYGTESGSRTANGEKFTGRDLTAAHRTLPFGTKLRVTYRGKSVVVRLNDRGPAAWTKRDLDLSRAAAQRIGLIPAGVGRVCVERI